MGRPLQDERKGAGYLQVQDERKGVGRLSGASINSVNTD